MKVLKQSGYNHADRFKVLQGGFQTYKKNSVTKKVKETDHSTGHTSSKEKKEMKRISPRKTIGLEIKMRILKLLFLLKLLQEMNLSIN